MIQKTVDRALESRKLKRLPGDSRYARQVSLSLRVPVGVLRQRRVVDSVELVRDVLRRQQHLRARAIELALVQRQSDCNERQEDDRLRDDPLAPVRHAQVVPQRGCVPQPGVAVGHLPVPPWT